MTINVDRTAADTKTIVVGVVNDSWAGSLAYALHDAPSEPAKVRIVRVSRPRSDRRHALPLPIDTVELEGDPVDVLIDESRHAQLLVVESPADASEALIDPLLTRLRDHTECLLVEVDHNGDVMRSSGPQGWKHVHEPATVDAETGEAAAERVITVGIDSSPSSAAAVRWARALAAQTGSALRLISVYTAENDQHGERSRLDAECDVHAAAEILGETSITVAVERGEPAEVLIESSRTSQLLVLGRHGTRGLIHNALGSVGDTCARLSDCPVVIVPED